MNLKYRPSPVSLSVHYTSTDVVNVDVSVSYKVIKLCMGDLKTLGMPLNVLPLVNVHKFS